MLSVPCHKVLFVKTVPEAVVPTKGTEFSVGYDLTAISVYKKISDKTTLYDTGIKVQPPLGFYTEILPRSSLSKTGYILSNSVGVIDPDYTGTLLIALSKIDDSMPDLILPFTRCQLILRKVEQYELVQVDSLDETVRSSGGFGSTDIYPERFFDREMLKDLSGNDLYIVPSQEEPLDEEVISVVMSQAKCDRETAVNSLKKHKNIVDAILELTP